MYFVAIRNENKLLTVSNNYTYNTYIYVCTIFILYIRTYKGIEQCAGVRCMPAVQLTNTLQLHGLAALSSLPKAAHSICFKCMSSL